MEETKEVKKQGRPTKKVSPNAPTPYSKVKLEIAGYKDNKPQLKEAGEVRKLKLSELDAKILNSQERNTLIRYKKL